MYPYYLPGKALGGSFSKAKATLEMGQLALMIFLNIPGFVSLLLHYLSRGNYESDFSLFRFSDDNVVTLVVDKMDYSTGIP